MDRIYRLDRNCPIKKILPQHKIVIYGYSSAESEKVTKAFLKAGYSDINIYYKYIAEWPSTIGLPMQNLERFPQLVEPGGTEFEPIYT